NIDLKGFSEGFYKTLCSGRLAPVLETLEYLKHKTNVWFEITHLLIPGENDSPAEIEAESAWVMDRLGSDVPLHFTAFHPDWKLTDRPPTPPQTQREARGSQRMRASITSIPAIFTTPRARLPTVIPVAQSSLAAIGMTSRRGIFPLTGVATNAGRAVTVFLKQRPATGVLAVSR